MPSPRQKYRAAYASATAATSPRGPVRRDHPRRQEVDHGGGEPPRQQDAQVGHVPLPPVDAHRQHARHALDSFDAQ